MSQSAYDVLFLVLIIVLINTYFLYSYLSYKHHCGKILLHYIIKYDPLAFDISTEEKEKTAWLKLFQHFDDCQYYYCIKDDGDKMCKLYDQAKNGDWESAKKLLRLRKNYEYEGWQIVMVQ